MAQTTPLIEALKKALKAHSRTYADTARYGATWIHQG